MEAIEKLNASGLQIALVVDGDGRLLGVVTDGNIRRAILDGRNLEEPVATIMTVNPKCVRETVSRAEMGRLMLRHSVHHLPVVDEAMKVVGLVTLDELFGANERPNWVVLMAGGLGKRLHPLTKDCPKPMLQVGGKPILESILEKIAASGFRHIFISVNYKAEMIKDFFGDGNRLGLNIDYLHEEEPLGTGGALTLLPERPEAPLVVMNGDLLTNLNFDTLLRFHETQASVATMAVREYDFQVPYGVVDIDGTQIKGIIEKPLHKFFVNAGIYTLSPEVLPYIPANTFFDMPALFDRLIADKKPVAAYPLHEYWLDIGRLEEFERAQTEWQFQVK